MKGTVPRKDQTDQAIIQNLSADLQIEIGENDVEMKIIPNHHRQDANF